jgi:hypothetical protein
MDVAASRQLSGAHRTSNQYSRHGRSQQNDPADLHYPESHHHRHPPSARYRGYERWDEDLRAAHPVWVNIYVENECRQEVEASGNSNASSEAAALIALALLGLVAFALILSGGPW